MKKSVLISLLCLATLIGSLWFFTGARQEVSAVPEPAIINVYAEDAFWIENWRQIQPGVNSVLNRVQNIALPATKDGIDGNFVKYGIIDGNNAQARLNPVPQTRLRRGTDYTASILVKADASPTVAWRLLFIGQFDGQVDWDSEKRQISYTGQANPSNSGYELCDNGWVRLWVRGATGDVQGPYEAPIFSLAPEGKPSAYLAGVSLWQGQAPASLCHAPRGPHKENAKGQIGTPNANLYAEQQFWLENWHQVQPGVNAAINSVRDVVAPATREKFAGGVAKYAIIDGNNADARLNPGAPTLLSRNTNYTASILVKPEVAQTVTWRLLFVGKFDGWVVWDTANRQIIYAGQANSTNSGYELCDDDWVRLWVRGATGSVQSPYEGPVLSLPPAGKPSVYLADASLSEIPVAIVCNRRVPSPEQAKIQVAKPVGNLFAEQRFWLENWRQVQPGVNATINSVHDVVAPATKEKFDGGVVKYAIVDGNSAKARLAPAVAEASLRSITDYTASILVKPETSPTVTWRLFFLDRFDGRIVWNAAKRQISYFGQANPSNSGYQLCDHGWVRLWIRGATGSIHAPDQGPIFSLAPGGKPSAYLANVSLSEGDHPVNSCTAPSKPLAKASK